MKRPASVGTAAQPKSIAVAADGTVFVSEIEHIEAFRSNQKVFDQKPKFAPSSIAASGSTIAIGGEASADTPAEMMFHSLLNLRFFY